MTEEKKELWLNIERIESFIENIKKTKMSWIVNMNDSIFDRSTPLTYALSYNQKSKIIEMFETELAELKEEFERV